MGLGKLLYPLILFFSSKLVGNADTRDLGAMVQRRVNSKSLVETRLYAFLAPKT